MSDVAMDTAVEPVCPGGGRTQKARGKILVVEDCEAVAKILSLVLEDNGYDAFKASDGDEAVSVFSSKGPFDLLITDVVMPGGICGYQLASALRLTNPKLPVIFITGYPLETVAKETGFSDTVQHLVKPAMISEIRSAVSAALEGKCVLPPEN